MRPLRPTGSVSPAFGALRGLRAGVLAVLCVLLPSACHVLDRCHAPRWIAVATVAGVAVPGCRYLTRRRLTDAQVLGALLAAQAAAHTAYALPGACRAAEHATPPAGVLLAGHLITAVVAARLLGVTERLLGRSRPLPAAVPRLLLFVRPLLGRVHGPGPRVTVRASASPLRSALLVRLHEGRAPPLPGITPVPPFSG
ncbi:hypothetical protein ACPXCS_09020 [Streptomyces sp. DT190]|uniref:hypothetical protein n=1 Tax=unclassified Streptomyces TaxID=2593676 RepID=UPI003CE9433F